MNNVNVKTEHCRKGEFLLTTLRVSVSGLPPSFQGYRMVQLSDLHYGQLTPTARIRSALYITRELEPQSILLTGDFLQVTRSGYRYTVARNFGPQYASWSDYRRLARRYTRELGEFLSELQAPDGVFAVLGNHDHIDGPQTITRYLGSHIHWLVNSYWFISRGTDSIRLSGVDDWSRGKPNTNEALEYVKRPQPPVFHLLLSHNPDITLSRDIAENSLPDMIISGHTHGGQVRFPPFKPWVTHTKQREHVRGLSFWRGVPLYVNSGLGYGLLPVRLFTPPEITLIELRAA